MKVTLKRLHLEYFKGAKELDIEFGEFLTNISGDNGCGKTTVFDAFTWCLFGKDSTGKSQFEIKTKDAQGIVIPQVDHSVEAILNVDSREIQLKRTLRECWVKQRGSAEVVMTGNETLYEYNHIQQKAGDYAKLVNEIMDEQRFRMITNPYFFPMLDASAQRQIITDMAGTVTYEDASKGDSKLLEIAKELSGVTMEAFRKDIAYRKKTIKEELDRCPVQIDAIRKVTPEAGDWKSIEAQIKELDGILSNQDKAMADAKSAMEIAGKERQSLLMKASDIDLQLSTIIKKALDGNNARRAKLSELESQAHAAAVATERAEQEISACEGKITAVHERAEADVDHYTDLLNATRKEWQAKNAEDFKAEEVGITCPLFNILCETTEAREKAATMQEKALASFNEEKSRTLAHLVKKGESYKAAIQKAKDEEKAEVVRYTQLAAEARQTASAKKEEAGQLRLAIAEIGTLPTREEITEKAKQGEEYQRLALEMEDLRTRAAAVASEGGQAVDMEKRASLMTTRDQLKADLAKRSVIEANEARIDEITERQHELAQQLAEVEGREYLTDTLQKNLMTMVEERVNAMFSLVRFQMYEKQINGGDKEVCNILVNGVKFGYGLNAASEINAGIDIINTMSKYYNISAPIFIDNAERVNNLLATDSQLIRLIVSHDNNLEIKKA